MARPRKDIEVLVASGKKHLTKAEIEQRRREKIQVPFTEVEPPDYLPESLRDEFNKYAHMLLAINIMTELDTDTLARYVLAHNQYLQYTSTLSKAIRHGNIDEMERLTRLQDKAFRQARSCAMDLGLTISSRARLISPEAQKPPEPKENKFMRKFGG